MEAYGSLSPSEICAISASCEASKQDDTYAAFVRFSLTPPISNFASACLNQACGSRA